MLRFIGETRTEEHGGCWNVEHFADGPAEFLLEKQKDWIAIKVIKSDKVYFYNSPNESKLKSYLVKGDIVKVLEQKNEWVKVEYESKKLTTGWIKKENLI